MQCRRGHMASLMRALVQAGARYARQQDAIENRRRREQERLYRAQIRAAAREQAKKDKAAYVEVQKGIAVDMGEKLLEEFTEQYSNILKRILNHKDISVFNSLIDAYHDDSIFVFDKPKPSFHSPDLEEVPKESWLEGIIKSKKEKRLQIIAHNKELSDEATIAYQKSLTTYKEEMDNALIQWENERKRKKEEYMGSISSAVESYLTGDVNVLKDYVEGLIEFSDLPLDVIESKLIGYQPNTKQLVLNISFKDRDSIFYAGGYRYLIQKDEFVTTKMKVSDANIRLRDLMTEVTMALIVLLYENDTANFFDSVVVNVIHDNICCISTLVDKQLYSMLDFSKKKVQYEFKDTHMRIFKTLKTGVKPFEFIYEE